MAGLRRALTAASIGWAVALPVAAWTAAQPQASTATYLFSFAAYAIGSAICHQLPERSFHLWSRQLPVCARCTGIYAGAALAALALALPPIGAGRRFSGASRVGSASPRTIAILAALPTLATLVFEWSTGVTPANWIRAATGLLLGAAAAWLVIRKS